MIKFDYEAARKAVEQYREGELIMTEIIEDDLKKRYPELLEVEKIILNERVLCRYLDIDYASPKIYEAFVAAQAGVRR